MNFRTQWATTWDLNSGALGSPTRKTPTRRRAPDLFRTASHRRNLFRKGGRGRARRATCEMSDSKPKTSGRYHSGANA